MDVKLHSFDAVTKIRQKFWYDKNEVDKNDIISFKEFNDNILITIIYTYEIN